MPTAVLLRMSERDTGGSEGGRTPATREADARDDGSTRRGFLGRTAALATVPVAVWGTGGVGDGKATTSGRRPATHDGPQSAAFAQSLDATAEFDCTYDGLDGESVAALAQTDDGGYVVAGGSWLAWTDDRGRLLASRTDEFEDGEPSATDVVPAHDGGFVVLGSSDGGCSLRSVDGDGSARWIREYTDEAEKRCASLVGTDDGGYAWVAEASGKPTVRVVDGEGATEWHRSYTYDGTDPEGSGSLAAVVQLDDGGFVLVGRVSVVENLDASPVWAVRTDADGNRVDDALLGYTPPVSRYHRVLDAVPTGDGGVAMTGYVGENPSVTTTPSTEFLFLTVGPDLEVRTDGFENPDAMEGWCEYAAANAMARTADGGFVLAGQSGACDVGNPDLTVARFARLNRDGEVEWTYTHPSDRSRTTVARDVVQTADGGVAAVGWEATDGGKSPWILKLPAEGSR